MSFAFTRLALLLRGPGPARAEIPPPAPFCFQPLLLASSDGRLQRSQRETADPAHFGGVWKRPFFLFFTPASVPALLRLKKTPANVCWRVRLSKAGQTRSRDRLQGRASPAEPAGDAVPTTRCTRWSRGAARCSAQEAAARHGQPVPAARFRSFPKHLSYFYILLYFDTLHLPCAVLKRHLLYCS